MDFGAYLNTVDTDIYEIVKKNGISCPRLRGYRLMEYEKPIGFKDLSEEQKVYIADCMCRSEPFWTYNASVITLDRWTDYVANYYLPIGEDGNPHIRWDVIHGWKRKALKTALHNEKMLYKKQYDTFDKYVGRPDVLYIHARIGGCNWPAYYKEVAYQPWFIEKVDDAFDFTYCDIYARIER